MLNVIVAKDHDTSGDFWRDQPFVSLPEVAEIRPKTYHDLCDVKALAGMRIGVPKMYINGTDSDPTARKVHTRQSVIDLWNRSRKVLEDLDATVVEIDFPVVTKFEAPGGDETEQADCITPPHRNEVDMCQLMAYAWDDFLAANADKNIATSLAQVDSASIFPRPPGTIPDKYDSDDPLVQHTAVVAHITGGRIPTYEIPGLENALSNLESKRKADYEDWLDAQGLDAVVWPCNGDVGKADADVNESSASDAWRNGVLYSNGNCAIRQLGIPTISVPMGIMADTKMPVNLTFAGKAYDDNNLLRYAYAYEKASRLRQVPERTPELVTDTIAVADGTKTLGSVPPSLSVKVARENSRILLSGSCIPEEVDRISIFVDGDEVHSLSPPNDHWEVAADVNTIWSGRKEEISILDSNTAMVVIVAYGRNGRSAGKLIFA